MDKRKEQIEKISTHTLRGERDWLTENTDSVPQLFQLTRSVGSVTQLQRDEELYQLHFNSHAPWGA